MLTLKCNPGQGEHGKQVKSFAPISRDACGQKCLEHKGCVGIDYTTDTRKWDQCRLYNHDAPRKDVGGDDRVYCTLETRGLE